MNPDLKFSFAMLTGGILCLFFASGISFDVNVLGKYVLLFTGVTFIFISMIALGKFKDGKKKND
jgi:hypothetical protein